MTSQAHSPFPCRQCGFCKEASRIGGGGCSSGYESAQFREWFCSNGCLQLTRLFNSEPGEIHKVAHDSLIQMYNRCYTKLNSNGVVIHIPRKNAEETQMDIENGKIYLVRSVYEPTSDDFGKYD
jgi:hypothetical protein